ncbi:MAG TPA: beta-L-arabinofuranosidase domain-containing protein [Anaerolineaceae bacterium]
MPPLSPLSYQQVRLTGGFWAQRQKINTTVTIPAIYQQFIENEYFKCIHPDWKPGVSRPAHIFYDSDWGKWLEAAAYSLALNPDPDLEAKVEAMIAQLASLQQPDGYLNSHFILVEPEKRWTNLRDWHELYCAGHLIEAAVALFQATGSRSLMDVMIRYVDYIDSIFGREPGKKRGYCGHPEIELALVRLYHATGEPRYLKLSQYFIEERGQQPHYYDQEAWARGDDPKNYWAKTYQYCQAHAPIREQERAVGHAVRAMYLYSGATDIARETGDASLLKALETYFDSTLKQLYLTGGIGPAAHNEGFTADYDLPNESAYAETCAAIALFLWAHRMLNLTGEGKYADVMEQTIYNGILSGISLEGDTFYYENPLAVDRQKRTQQPRSQHRQKWYSCACCPPNVARLIGSMGGYLYAQTDQAIIIHHYAQGEASFTFHGKPVHLSVKTDYPWNGSIHIMLTPEQPAAFNLRLHVPGWCRKYSLQVNGQALATRAQDGYLAIERTWQPGDTLSLDLEMPVDRIYAHPQVCYDRGRVALRRGPVVYCLEGADNPDPVDWISLPRHARLEATYQPDLLGGVMILHGRGARILAPEASGLYTNEEPRYEPCEITAIPFFAWDNRAEGDMRVWINEI